MAELLTGAADTVTLVVIPKLGTLVKVSGDAQSGPVSVGLALPVVTRVLATDGLPLSGVLVNFAASGGGLVGVSSAVSDASGNVQTTWTLGPLAGAQSLTATVPIAPAATVTFSATASAPASVLIHLYPLNGSVIDAVGSVNGSLVGGATLASGVLTLDGSTGYAQFPSQIVPTSGSYSVSLFVRNRTPLTQYAEYISQGTSSAPGFYIGQSNSGIVRAGDSWFSTAEPAPGLP